jgi:alpha-glucosidase
VSDIPDELIADPVYERTGHMVRGRDGCRVPLPWQADAPGFGFGPAGSAAPWLPQPAEWRQLAADAQDGDGGSMLELYRAALRVRGQRAGLDDDAITWLDADAGVLAFSRPGGLLCVVNTSGYDIDLPEHASVLLASAGLAGGRLPADAAAWLLA